MDIPVITSLWIRAEFELWQVVPSLDDFFPDDHLPDRPFPNPPIFEVWPDCGDGFYDSLKVNIGSCHIQFDIDMDDNEAVSDIIMSCILPLVPPSAPALRLDYSDLEKEEWMEFFWSHLEVRSIEFSSLRDGLISENLWNALSPIGTDGITLCSQLEPISLSQESASVSLLNCLLNRKNAGYGLKRLKVWKVDIGFVEKLRPLVEELEAIGLPNESMQRWGRRLPPEVEYGAKVGVFLGEGDYVGGCAHSQ